MNSQSVNSSCRIRPLEPDDDLVALTQLLHRCYRPLAERGLRYLATHQDVDTTRRRCGRGDCFIAELAGRIVGTITLSYHNPAASNGTPWYERPDVAHFMQFAVEPSLQRQGIGSALVDAVERRAAERGMSEVALDTAEPAADLIAFYERRGYRFIEHAQWSVTNYRSVVMSKSLRAAVT